MSECEPMFSVGDEFESANGGIQVVILSLPTEDDPFYVVTYTTKMSGSVNIPLSEKALTLLIKTN